MRIRTVKNERVILRKNPANRLGSTCARLLVFLTLVTVSVASSNADTAALKASVERCAATLDNETTASAQRCPDLHANAQAAGYPLTDSDGTKLYPNRAQLEQLSQTLADLAPAPANTLANDNARFDEIMSDYSYEQDVERIGFAQRAMHWLAQQFKKLGLGDTVGSVRDFLSIEQDTRDLISFVFKGIMGLVVLVAVASFARALWRYLDPNLSRANASSQLHAELTGAQRGNLPVMSNDRIAQLDLSDQPPAMLVASLDKLRGKHLPDNVWKHTNREISQMLATDNSPARGPMDTLILIAERALYGDRLPGPDDIDECKSALQQIESFCVSSDTTDAESIRAAA